MMETPFIAQEISRFPTIIMYFRERFKFGNGCGSKPSYDGVY